jgi:uncharacterized protein DUF4386
MTTRTNALTASARIAGIAFLFYIAAGITSMNLTDQPNLTAALSLLMSFSALALGVTLYALTRDQGPALAMFAMTCRLVEAVPTETGETNAIFFAVGSTIFCWLMLRGRMIPAVLAWLGVVASALLVVILPLQLARLFGGPMAWSDSITWIVWLPMLVFEVVLSLWLLIKGVATPTPNVASSRTD